MQITTKIGPHRVYKLPSKVEFGQIHKERLSVYHVNDLLYKLIKKVVLCKRYNDKLKYLYMLEGIRGGKYKWFKGMDLSGFITFITKQYTRKFDPVGLSADWFKTVERQVVIICRWMMVYKEDGHRVALNLKPCLSRWYIGESIRHMGKHYFDANTAKYFMDPIMIWRHTPEVILKLERFTMVFLLDFIKQKEKQTSLCRKNINIKIKIKNIKEYIFIKNFISSSNRVNKFIDSLFL